MLGMAERCLHRHLHVMPAAFLFVDCVEGWVTGKSDTVVVCKVVTAVSASAAVLLPKMSSLDVVAVVIKTSSVNVV